MRNPPSPLPERVRDKFTKGGNLQRVYDSLLSGVGAEDQSLGAEVDFDLVAFLDLALYYLLG